MMGNSESTGAPLLLVWIALNVLFALLVSFVAGVLAWLGGQTAALAALTGGEAFGGTLTVALAIIAILSARGRP
jgi:hypothetical protein